MSARYRNKPASPPGVPGGVKLGGSSSPILLIAALIGLPPIAVLLVPDLNVIARICATVALGSSAVLFVGVLSGRISRRFLRFDPSGLTIGEAKFEFLIPWDEIADIVEFEMDHDAMVGFDILRPENIQVTPQSARARVLEMLSGPSTTVRRHVMIRSSQFGAHAGSLCPAIRTYAGNREARVELAARPALTAPEA